MVDKAKEIHLIMMLLFIVSHYAIVILLQLNVADFYSLLLNQKK